MPVNQPKMNEIHIKLMRYLAILNVLATSIHTHYLICKATSLFASPVNISGRSVP